MNTLNSESKRAALHHAHRGPANAALDCRAHLRHRHHASVWSDDGGNLAIEDLELVELRYEFLRARMEMEALFCDGALSVAR